MIDDTVKAGTPSAKITIQGQGRPRLTYNGPEYSLVQVQRPNWIIDSVVIDVQRQKKVAVAFSGNTDGSALTRSEAFGGTSGAGVTTYGGARNVTFEANEIHDFSEGDEDSHGVLVQPTSKNITVRGNQIHDVSGDSVQCIGPEGYSTDAPADGVLIENNELTHNRENAVDIKTCSNVTVRHNLMHDFRNALPGGCIVVIHMSAKNVLIEDNDIYDGGKGIALGGNHVGPPPSGVAILKNRIYDIVQGPQLEGVGIRVENSTGAVVFNNTFTRIIGPVMMIGFGTGGATQDLTVENDLFASPVGIDLGPQAPGLKMDHNLYQDGVRFQDSKGALQSLSAWKAMRLDVHSDDASGAQLLGANWAPGPSAQDQGVDVGLPFCGKAPDIGATETGCSSS
jgi:hypothetical protein